MVAHERESGCFVDKYIAREVRIGSPTESHEEESGFGLEPLSGGAEDDLERLAVRTGQELDMTFTDVRNDEAGGGRFLGS